MRQGLQGSRVITGRGSGVTSPKKVFIFTQGTRAHTQKDI